MGNIDTSKMITAEARAAQAAEERALMIKAVCEASIKAILDDNTVKNLMGAALVGGLSDEQRGVFAAGQLWVQAMIGACRTAIATGTEPAWPAIPDGLEALAQEF
jgi:hypothetical protein